MRFHGRAVCTASYEDFGFEVRVPIGHLVRYLLYRAREVAQDTISHHF
jgi:hypothetical protein